MRNLRIGALGAAVLMVAAACGGSSAPAAENVDFKATSYPATGAAPCAAGQTGLSQISSTDEHTVVFKLCAPDVAFLQKLSLTNFVIQDSGYLKAHAADGSIVSAPNGTGPFKFTKWERGTQIVLTRFENYWGTKALAKQAVIQWQDQAAARLLSLQSGAADGIDNVSPTDFAAVKADTTLALYPREGLNILYLGMNNTYKPFDNVNVRKAIALALNRQQIVDLFYPGGSVVATHFTPCSIEFACEGDDWYAQNIDEAKSLLASAGFPNGFKTTLSLRDKVRGYLPDPVGVATEIQSQLKAIGVDVTIDVQESTTYLDNASAGKLTGLHLLGWGADYPDPTNFLDYHFGANSSLQFGTKYSAITDVLTQAGSTSDAAQRKSLYAQANNAIKENIPMIPIAHGGSGVAFKADVAGGHASPLGAEELAAMKPGSRDSLVWVQNGEPGGLYCADETDGESLRVCGQIAEGLYGFETGTATIKPLLAKSCTASADLLTWTCTLQSGVKFHNGAVLDATDVVDTFASIWDCAHPYHKGRTSVFEYWGLIGPFLNADKCAVAQ
jgi:ABC-type transport system substrate-binding protein